LQRDQLQILYTSQYFTEVHFCYVYFRSSQGTIWNAFALGELCISIYMCEPIGNLTSLWTGCWFINWLSSFVEWLADFW